MTLIQNELNRSNDYLLTLIEGTDLVELSSKNVAIVEAMLRNDSTIFKTYNRDAAPKGKYGGSTAYWMLRLKCALEDNSSITEDDYNRIITEAVAAVDRDNSTHLNADGVGRKEIPKRLCSIERNTLKDYLRNPKSSQYELISIISQQTNPTGVSANGKEYKARTNVSFASKFCHYACYYLFEGEEEQDNYSIFDNILSKAIPLYVDYYKLGKCKLSNYEEYIATIDEIIRKAQTPISRNGFDHLLWVYYRGRLI